MPTGRAGNYVAPVDTTAMDPEMKETLGITNQPKPDNPIVAGLKKMFGGADRPKATTAAQKSANVKRTSDVPQLNAAAAKMEDQFSAERKSGRVSRTSDIPVVNKGQGLQGNRKNTGTAGGY